MANKYLEKIAAKQESSIAPNMGVLGGYAGAGAGFAGVHKLTKMHESAKYYGNSINAMKSRGEGKSTSRGSALHPEQQRKLYSKLGPIAQVSKRNKFLSKLTTFSNKNFGRNMIAGGVGGAALGATTMYNAFKPNKK